MGGSTGRGSLGSDTNSPQVDEQTMITNQTQDPGCNGLAAKDTKDLLGHCVMLIEDPQYGAHHEKVMEIMKESIEESMKDDPRNIKAFEGKLSGVEMEELVQDHVNMAFSYLKTERDTRDTQELRDAEHYLFTLAEYSDGGVQQEWLAFKSTIYSGLKTTELGRHVAGAVAGDGWDKPASVLGDYEHHYNKAGSLDRFDTKKYIKEKISEAGEKQLKKKQELKEKFRRIKAQRIKEQESEEQSSETEEPIMNITPH